ncbi:Uncharacterised protein [Klebsiella pneumoniae]|uniref:hypothetical protein n=1 Tax=Klebsiella pneumoniae TaxID=573 RepID=UPI000E2AB8FF|nr:hypothetical protein [Klebsiella pneumoniae]MBS2044396.1 hypothetical protein [Klebsiella pneumoniae]MDR4637973.1 hypothetical protein [Klebsiella pneumoniae]WLY12747.1 hypothetical protein RA220_07175 [Klebsiella pneumoniae]WLY23803.1 hypothetical protein RA200_07175 [Klebsiella pneumoniae]CAE7607599.1 hypothetical protein AI2773V2_1956 [Klebsiella pneumoniae]
MTKSTITRERIQRIIRAIDSEAYDEEEIREWLSSDEIMELARIALAAMDSEPVAYIFKHPAGRLFWALTDESNKGQNDVMPVYASPQPAPVVQDGYVMVPKEPTSEMVKKMRYHVGSYDRNIKDGYKAMLAASPQEVTNGK